MLNMKNVDTVRLTLKSRFRFRCHKDISCFTKCCSNIDIMLTPYDIVVLKNKFNMTSYDFLEKYTYTDIEQKSSHPFVYLRMQGHDLKNCSFLTHGGCSIYEDRPASCRYYPVGQGTLKKAVDGKIIDEEFYFLVREDHCKGFEEQKEWTIEEWRNDQGVDRYDGMNREWKSILLRRNLPGNELDEKKQAMFYMACYDLDRFRSFIFNSRFLDVFQVDDTEREKMKEDDAALMLFGFKFLKYMFMIEETIKAKPTTQ